MKEFIWLKRTKQWIKENPGKGTMYKALRPEIIIKPDITASDYRKKKYAEKTNTEYDPQKGRDAGIYVICCEKTKHAYVGQSMNMDVRMRNHKMNICGKLQCSAQAYDKMRKHFQEFGIESFSFTKHIIIPSANTNILCDIEAKTMYEFIERGYILYNKNINFGANVIHCPSDIKDVIKTIIEKSKSDPTIIKKILQLL